MVKSSAYNHYTVIEDVEDDIDKLPHSYFSNAVTRVYDKTDNGKSGVLQLEKSVDLIEILEENFHTKELAVHLQKLDPNESGSFDCFDFLRWYVDEEFSLESAKEA